MLLEKCGGQLLIVPEKMKKLGQSGNEAPLWMSLLVKVKSSALKNNIRTWNVRSINQEKLEVVKQEMARVNIDILEVSELKRTGMGEFNTDDHCICYCRQESLRRNGVALRVNKRVQNAELGTVTRTTDCSLLVSKANHSLSQQSKSMSQPLMPKKLKLNGSKNTYKTF